MKYLYYILTLFKTTFVVNINIIVIFAVFKFNAVQSRRVISAFFVPIHIENKV